MKDKIPINIPNFLTLLNVISGLGAMFSAIKGYYVYAAGFLIAAFLFDFFDGFVARRLRQVTDFGKEMDSLGDVISFGVAPVVFGFMLNSSWIAIAGYVFFLSCGVLRLARFNVQTLKGGYYGMPITFNAVIVVVMYILLNPVYYPIVYFIAGGLMISRFRLKKVIK